MLQRSPTYVVSRPAEDKIANGLKKLLPAKTAYGLTRWKNVSLQMLFDNSPARNRRRRAERIIKLAQRGASDRIIWSPSISIRSTILGTSGMCLIPDGDLFNEIKKGRPQKS